MKVLTVIGARPQIIKAAAISRVFREQYADQVEEIILHTGQHFDKIMSDVFFTELGVPTPKANLEIQEPDRVARIQKMTDGIVHEISVSQPNVILVYGDTDSTHAAALAAEKTDIPLIHVEAGLRSFDQSMPEEINRIECDKRSTLLFSPTKQGVANLKEEGISDSPSPNSIGKPAVFHCGDVMYDNASHFRMNLPYSSALNELELNREFILATIHRPVNTDYPDHLRSIFEALIELSGRYTIVLPIHPRTKKCMDEFLEEETMIRIRHSDIRIIEPVSYLNMISLQINARMIVTDSGGLQKEAFFFKKPCVVLRDNTEWVELVDNGNSILAGADKQKISEAVALFEHKTFSYPEFYGDGHAAEFICSEIVKLKG